MTTDNGDVKYVGVQYLMTEEDVRHHSLTGAPIGQMTPVSTHVVLQSRANEIASAHGVARAQLIIVMFFRPGMSPVGYSPVTYPIASFEWEDWLCDTPMYFEKPCDVYVVDGTKYTAPI